ncbi:MAG: histidine kinase [Paenibacillus sp.]|nr:histidine kinase [Paenibacillus sp.]
MSFWRFLKYERPYLFLVAVALLLTLAVSATDPHMRWSWPTFYYALSLVAIWLGVFLLYRYTRQMKAARHLRGEETEPLSLEAEAYRDALEQAEREHIHALNEVHMRQAEHYDFIVSWFHEIKTPIAVLRLMQQTELDRRSLDEQIGRIEHYVDQALYYAKLDNFNQDYEIVNCDLEPLVKEAVKAHSKTFIAKKIKIRLDLPPTVVQSDSKWLFFILNQLLTNSLKYTAEQGEITITASADQREKRLVVRDDGIGIASQDIPRIFNRGFTGANGRTHVKSTGMGLYLAQELANKLGHYISCESEAGRYTAMTIHFPKHDDAYLHVLAGSER